MYALFVFSHVIGALLGTGAATFAEIFVVKALRDGVIEPLESDYLKTIYTVLRIGLFITIISGFGFLFYYRITGQETLIYNPKLWAKLTIIVIILFNALLLQAHKLPLTLGSAISLTSWYAAFFLGMWQGLSAGYGEILLWYATAVIAAYLILRQVHKFFGLKV